MHTVGVEELFEELQTATFRNTHSKPLAFIVYFKRVSACL